MDDVLMADAALIGASGSWSPSAVLAGLGQVNDRTQGADREGVSPAVAFERALAEELQKAGDLHLFDFGFDPDNGAALDRAADVEWLSGRADRTAAGDFVAMDTEGPEALASSQKRVGFGDEEASSRLAGGRDRFDRGLEPGDQAAFWIGDRVTTHPALKSKEMLSAEEQGAEAAPIDRVFFNGDGRPIVLPSIDAGEREAVDAGDALAADGDLMILPNGAVLAYDPWTVTVESPLPH